jgi:hypothetical protein
MAAHAHDNLVSFPSPSRIECLNCGHQRPVEGRGPRAAGECPRCRYLGWAYAAHLDEVERRELRDRPLEERALDRVVGL